MGGKGTKPGAPSSLQCPEITRVKLITNVDGTELFILGQSGQKYAEVEQRARDRVNKKERAMERARDAEKTHEDGMSTVAWLEVTDKRQGKDNEVYIYECKNRTQRLVDIVDQ